MPIAFKQPPRLPVSASTGPAVTRPVTPEQLGTEAVAPLATAEHQAPPMPVAILPQTGLPKWMNAAVLNDNHFRQFAVSGLTYLTENQRALVKHTVRASPITDPKRFVLDLNDTPPGWQMSAACMAVGACMAFCVGLAESVYAPAGAHQHPFLLTAGIVSFFVLTGAALPHMIYRAINFCDQKYLPQPLRKRVVADLTDSDATSLVLNNPRHLPAAFALWQQTLKEEFASFADAKPLDDLLVTAPDTYRLADLKLTLMAQDFKTTLSTLNQLLNTLGQFANADDLSLASITVLSENLSTLKIELNRVRDQTTKNLTVKDRPNPNLALVLAGKQVQAMRLCEKIEDILTLIQQILDHKECQAKTNHELGQR